MVLKRAEWPAPDEYAVAVATKVAPYGAYVELPEYGDKEGFIHISEVSSTWVRNIRNHIHENQRIVVRVLDVDKRKGHIDCSLRRVSDEAKRAKNEAWKRAQKAEKLLEIVGEKTNKSLEEIYEEIGWPLEDNYGEIYKGLEMASVEGKEALEDIDTSKKIKDLVAELAADRIEIPSIEIDGEVSIRVPGPGGVEVIKDALKEGLEVAKGRENSSLDIYTLGSPRYKLRIESLNYKEGEDLLSDVLQQIRTKVEKSNGSMEFKRK
ncbi:MAG: translation initiation factor IF-2 subunit alpha [Candidatus Lokiarchaeota archaeon]|nr:translation initiation factor IF-2 subunit alpha [Candidatus Lokiarchaeota archaeon]